MALEVSIIFNWVKVTPRLRFVLGRVTTNGTAEVIKFRLDLFELLKTRGDQTNKFRVNKIH